MEEEHRCKLCLKSFGSGRALGGHMRSHMMKMSSSSKRLQGEDDDEEEQGQAMFDVVSDSSTSLSSDEINSDRESETESCRKKTVPICRRSKRVRKSRISDFNTFSMEDFFAQSKKPRSNSKPDHDDELELSSSISDTTPEEHVAHCLIMLSRDKWNREEDEEVEVEGVESDGQDEVMKKTSKVKGKYRCETCNKLFRSYQALGGHRASHNKVKVNSPDKIRASDSPVPEKIHCCPFCHRIFSSGQALGGHKRSHFAIGGGLAIKSRVGDAVREILDIDLNLPAPTEEDDDNSQIDVSAVSDADFVGAVKQ